LNRGAGENAKLRSTAHLSTVRNPASRPKTSLSAGKFCRVGFSPPIPYRLAPKPASGACLGVIQIIFSPAIFAPGEWRGFLFCLPSVADRRRKVIARSAAKFTHRSVNEGGQSLSFSYKSKIEN